MQSVAVTREGLSLGEDDEETFMQGQDFNEEQSNKRSTAMVCNEEMGWVKEPNGPNSASWRRTKRLNKSHSPKTLLKTSGTKQVGPIPLQELDPNITDLECIN